jgi:hypothetical protein
LNKHAVDVDMAETLVVARLIRRAAVKAWTAADRAGGASRALLDMSPGWAPGMVRGWPHLMQSPAELWAVLPPAPTVSANGGPIAILAAMGSAVGPRLAAGHWSGCGPRDEVWEQIASNLMQGRRLLHEQPVACEAVPALATEIQGQTCAFFYGNYGKFLSPQRATLFLAKSWSP